MSDQEDSRHAATLVDAAPRTRGAARLDGPQWSGDRRLRCLPRRGSGMPSSKASPSDIGDALDPSRSEDDFVWIGLHEPTEEEMELVVARASGCTGSRSRTRSARTSVRSWSATTATCSSWCSRRSGTSTSDDAVETGEIAVFVGPDVRRDGAARQRRSSSADARRDLEEHAEVLGHGPFAVLYSVCDSVVDALRGGRGRARDTTSTRSSCRSSPTTAPTTPARSTTSSARWRSSAVRSCRCATR